MRFWGIFLAIVGAIYLVIAFNMGVSVAVSTTYVPGYGSIGGGEVANLDLMARRQNHLIVAAVITLVGALMAILGKNEETQTEVAESAAASSGAKAFTGECDLTNDGYRLWLATTYSIERNQVFDRFVLNERTFDTLDDALYHAHELETVKAHAIEKVMSVHIAAADKVMAKKQWK